MDNKRASLYTFVLHNVDVVMYDTLTLLIEITGNFSKLYKEYFATFVIFWNANKKYFTEHYATNLANFRYFVKLFEERHHRKEAEIIKDE